MRKLLQTNIDNVSLAYQIDEAKNPKANVVINHGFAEHIGRYDYVSKKLVEAGYNVLRYNLRGHGDNKGERGEISSYQDFIFDADLMVELIREKYPHLKTFMLGHSMGGLITTLYGLTYPNKLAGQVLSGAANGKLPATKGIKSSVLKLAAKVIPKKHKDNPVTEDICRVPEVVEDYLNDDLVLKSASFNFYNEFLNKATSKVIKNLDQYNLPVLILHGKDDKIVPASISENLYKTIASVDKTLKFYPKLYHEILNESIKDEVISDIIMWFNKH